MIPVKLIVYNTTEMHIMQPKGKTHQSLERALEILLAFKPYNKEMGTLGLSHCLGLHKSTVSRLLSVLKSFGFVQQNPHNRKYSIGPAIAELGAVVQHSLKSRLTLLAQPFLDELRNELEETVVLEIPYTDRTVIAFVAEGFGPVRIHGAVGDRQHYHSSAGGKVLLAFSDAGFKERIMSDKMARRTPNTIIKTEHLERELEIILKQGFAFDREENNTGIQAYGVPVFNREAKAAAAVIVAGSSQIVTWERRSELIPRLSKTARLISSQLFFRDPNAEHG